MLIAWNNSFLAVAVSRLFRIEQVMKNTTLLNGLCRLLGLYFGVAGLIAFLDTISNVLMYWNLRARPYGSLWSLSSLAGPLLEIAIGTFLCFQSRRVVNRLVRNDQLLHSPNS